MIRTAFKTNDAGNTIQVIKDQRGSRRPVHKVDHTVVYADIERYQLAVPHYHREHVPNRRYLSSELKLRDMYEEFINSGQMMISYNTYYQIFREMNISFTKLGNEECEACAEFDQHKKSCTCEYECLHFRKYVRHKKMYRAARKHYVKDSEERPCKNHLRFSADLQKVVMLPMMEQFKRSIFTRRLCCFNETFSPLGQYKQKGHDMTVL